MSLTWERIQRLDREQLERVGRVQAYCKTLRPSIKRHLLYEFLIEEAIAGAPLPMVSREVPWPPPPAIDNWISRSTPVEYELPELVAERRSKVRGRNGIVLRARRFAARHNEGIREGLFWAALLCVLVMLGGLYLILENLGWFRL